MLEPLGPLGPLTVYLRYGLNEKESAVAFVVSTAATVFRRTDGTLYPLERDGVSATNCRLPSGRITMRPGGRVVRG